MLFKKDQMVMGVWPEVSKIFAFELKEESEDPYYT